MKRLEASTRKWIDQTTAELADVKKALGQMTRAIKKAALAAQHAKKLRRAKAAYARLAALMKGVAAG